MRLRDFIQPFFHMRVLVAYRPLYEWLPSKYNSWHKHARNPSARAWPGELTPMNITGKVLLPFDLDDRGKFTEEVVKPIETSRMHITHSTLLAYQNQGVDAEVIHLPFSSHSHKEGEYMDYLMCDLLNASALCDALKKGAFIPSGAKNPSKSFDGDVIAVAAYQAGLIPKAVERNVAARIVIDFFDETVQSLSQSTKDSTEMWPIKCLDDKKLKRIYKLSWDTHCKLFCQGSDPKAEEQHHFEAFEQNKYRFCGANAERIVADKNFTTFLQQRLW
eukprot:CAMPEP_0172446066 /NCGR_PEP_ID=MMETSP1065-20121228/5751_1 /TAXON_ID=265537 /ORGANISM="Amphiprora paludosa, Strain CCMP125" /LENGTH=274 /DNA_ID=CAMNT_0013197085 /DNA_START=75 /DNA_END=896 /DNA_ORIENTATION=+